jgi:hypothetical protein
MASPADSGKAAKPAWRKWLRRVLIGVGVIVLCLLAVRYISFLIGESRLKQASEEADRLDRGWRLLELEAKRAVIPDAENGALQALAAQQLLPKVWPEWPVSAAKNDEWYINQVQRVIARSFDELTPPVQLGTEQIAALRAELERARPALEKARKLADMPKGRFKINWPSDPAAVLGTPLPPVQRLRDVGNLLTYDAMLRAQESDIDGALISCRAALNTGRSIGDEPLIISQLIRAACTSGAVRKVERVLAQGGPSEVALVAVQRTLEQEADEPLLLFAMRGERAFGQCALEGLQAADMRNSLRSLLRARNSRDFHDSFQGLVLIGTVKAQRAALLRFMNRVVEISKQPTEKQDQQLKELEDSMTNAATSVRLLGPAVTKIASTFCRNCAELRCAAVAVAVERYRRAHAQWPNSLTALVPTYIEEVPVDPFDGKPLRFGRFDEGIVVYSVGHDGVDNGGVVTKNPGTTGSDLGFRLWDLKKRRQAPVRLEIR